MFHRIESLRLERKRLKRRRKDAWQELVHERQLFNQCIAREGVMFFKSIYNDLVTIVVTFDDYTGRREFNILWQDDVCAKVSRGYAWIFPTQHSQSVPPVSLEYDGEELEEYLRPAFRQSKAIALTHAGHWDEYRHMLNENTLSFLFQSRVLYWIAGEFHAHPLADVLETQVIPKLTGAPPAHP
jgi:hypothetical protein